MLDEVVWLSVDITDFPAFHKLFFLLINVAVGGD